MKSYSDVKHQYNLLDVVTNRISRTRQTALFTIVLGCLSWGGSAARAQSVSKVSCQTSSFSSAGTDACTVDLNGAALSQVPVYLYSSDPALTVPNPVYVDAGASSVAFSATLTSVSAARTVWITAEASTAMGATTSFGIQLSPLKLGRISCQSAAFSSAGTDACSVYLSGATEKPTAVFLYSNDPALTVPAVVYANAGASTVGFSAALASVSTARTVWITGEASSAMGTTMSYGIHLTPSGSAGPSLSVSATSVSFGGVRINSQSTQTVTLTANGSQAVTVNSASVSGSGFSVSGSTFPVTLNPGQALSVYVEFAPTATGAATGQLTIASNSSSNSAVNVSLSGTGTSHVVDLTWNAPSSSPDPVAGYNVYRAPQGTSSFQRLNSSPVAQTAFADSTVTSGQTYVYMVKSTDSAGVESVSSSTTTVSVP